MQEVGVRKRNVRLSVEVQRMSRASGDDDMSRESRALVVYAETRKLLRELEEEALYEREMFACRAL